MLCLRRGVVLAAGDPAGPMQQLDVRLGGDRRPAVADVALVGAVHVGDEVIVNVAALDLELGPGAFDVVHANLTRGLEGAPAPGAHVMKLDYTSLQHPVVPVEESTPADAPITLPTGAPAAVLLLHGQLAPLAWAFHRAAPGARLGFVQTGGGALPGALSETVRLLRARGLLAAHLTAGPAYGGEGDAVTTAGALQHGFAERHWHAAVCGPGPGVPDSATALGHGGMIALESAHTAAALGCQVVICPRRSSADRRARHRGISHHTRMLLELALVPFVVAHAGERPRAGFGRHEWRQGEADLDAYAASGLPARTLEQDPEFFAAALAAGSVLAQCAA
jgi:Protein of unknown function (DUF3866)